MLIFLRGQNYSLEMLRKKKCKIYTVTYIIYVKHEEKNCKGGLNAFFIMHTNLKILRKTRKGFARLQDRENVTFINSEKYLLYLDQQANVVLIDDVRTVVNELTAV